MSGLRLDSQHNKSHYAKTIPRNALEIAFFKSSHSWTRDSKPRHLTWAKEVKRLWLRGPMSSFLDKSKCCMSFGKTQSLEWGRKSGTKSGTEFGMLVVVVWWSGAMSPARVGPLCFLKSTVNAANYQEMLQHLMLPSANKLSGDANGTKSWFNDHDVPVLDWPAHSPDLNPIEQGYQT